MKEKKEIELEVRRWLDFVVKEKSYNSGVLIALTNLYFQGADDLSEELKNLLNITDCTHDY